MATLYGTSGCDFFNGTSVPGTTEGDDLIYLYSGGDTVQALGGNDTINAGSGADSINAGGGNNVLMFGGGDDTLVFGSGYDVIDVGVSAGNFGALDVVMGSGGGSIRLTGDGALHLTATGMEPLVLLDTGGSPFVPPAALNNVVLGGGDDSVNVRNGGEYNIGEGSNLFRGYSDVVNHIVAGAGADTIDISLYNRSSLSVGSTISAGAGANLIYDGKGNDSLLSGAGSDTIYSIGGDDTISSGGGNDILNLGIFMATGSDSINAGEGDNGIKLGAGSDTVVVGAGNDSIYSNSYGGEDTLYATLGWGVDTVTVQGGAVVIRGGAQGAKNITATYLKDVQLGEGADSIYGGMPNDGGYIWAGGGDDSILISSVWSGSGAGVIFCASGADSVYASLLTNDFKINGAEGADLLFSGVGADSITGGADNDTIYAGSGADTVNGAQGADYVVLNGAYNSAPTDNVADLFYFQSFAAGNFDTVLAATGDKIDIPNFAYTLTTPTAGTFVLTFDANNILTLKGINALSDVILF